MADINEVLIENRAAVDEVIAAADRSKSVWSTAPAPGKWSPSQIVEHVARSLEEAEVHAAQLASLGASRVVAVDAAAMFSRPGPRLVDGLELLAHVLHPDRVREAPGVALDVELPARAG